VTNNSKIDGKKRPDITAARAKKQRARRARLAEALRANLRKRKEQRHTPNETSETGDQW